jgi:hypothetical protein
MQLLQKNPKIPSQGKNIFITLRPESSLTDGVTVALQFLELSVQVRILVGQQPAVKSARLTLNEIRRNALSSGGFVFFRLIPFKVDFQSSWRIVSQLGAFTCV